MNGWSKGHEDAIRALGCEREKVRMLEAQVCELKCWKEIAAERLGELKRAYQRIDALAALLEQQRATGSNPPPRPTETPEHARTGDLPRLVKGTK